MARRAHPVAWLRAHPTAADALLAAAVLAFAAPGWAASGSESGNDASFRAMDAGGVALLLVQVVPLTGRRRWPVATFLVMITAWVVAQVVGYEDLGSFGPIIGAYSVGAWATERRDLVVTGVGAVLVAAVGTLLDREDVTLAMPVVVLVVLGVAYLIGASMRRRRVRVAELEAEAARLSRERELEARQAVAEERSRIARELHDVVAHSLSVMVVQAGAARRVVASDAQAAAEALGAIEATGRDALVEMRRLLGVLRSERATPDERAPQPRLARLDELAAADPSLPVAVHVEGAAVPLPPSVELSAYRIVQEALTNVRKHAGPARAEVRVAYGEATLRVEVLDDGRGAASHPAQGSGQGLVGMRERAALCGGAVHAGPRAGGGWRVAAVLPYDTTGHGSPPRTTADATAP